MILISIGLPGPFAEWCDGLIRDLVESNCGSTESVALNTFDELAAAALRSPAEHIVVCCRQPVARLQSELTQSGRPFVIALADPRAALYDLVERGCSIADASRAVASSCATMLSLVEAPGALVLTPENASDPRQTAAAVARHLRLPIAEHRLRLRSKPPAAAPDLATGDTESRLEELPERERAIAAGALACYISYFYARSLERMVWEPELFFTPATGDTFPLPADGVIDITGRSRCLLFGPYINLPPGSWSVEIALGFSAEAAGVGFLVEAYAGSRLAHARIEPTGEQLIETRLSVAITEAVDQPLEIRLFNERAAFDGRLAVVYVAVTPETGAPAEARERFANLLRR